MKSLPRYFSLPVYQRGAGVLALIFLLGLAPPAPAREFRTLDPSGQWQGQHGVLSLMLAGDALSFAYSAVFGATGHLCDGAGVAGLVADGEYHYVDDQGTVAFVVTDQGVKMTTVTGIASFCGANWPGDEFTRQGYKPVGRGTVTVQKAYFYVVKPGPPQRRRGYVIQGDRVDTAPACFDGGDAWVLARYRGAKAVTAGLLRQGQLECLD